jgi:hypothetical protein
MLVCELPSFNPKASVVGQVPLSLQSLSLFYSQHISFTNFAVFLCYSERPTGLNWIFSDNIG